MKTKQTIENIQTTFIVGLKGIIKTSGFFKDIWKYGVSKYSIIIAVVIPIISLFFNVDFIELINEIQLQMIVFLPCILGFTIAGYALVVGFVQSNMLNKITEPAKDSNFSLYQIMSSKFGMNVVLQGVALIFAYIYHFILFFQDKGILHFRISKFLCETINFVGLTVISFWFIISVLLVVQIVINIFNFSQLHHYFINIEKVRVDDKITDKTGEE